MPVPARTALGAATTVRKFWLDVDTSAVPHTTPTWVPIMGVTDFKPSLSPKWQDDSDFDGGGDKSSTATAREWGVELKVVRKVTAASATAYDPGQEVLRLRAEELGVGNSIPVRFYEMEEDGPRVEAYSGNVGVEWSPDGGNMEGLDTVSVKLVGQGKRSAITHPDGA
jgi:hypothetical protein